MEENIEKIGLGKGSRKNGSTTTNHIDNIGMSVYKKRHRMAKELFLPVTRQNDFLFVLITQIQVVTVTSICFGFVICLGPYYIFAAFRILGVAFLRNNNACDIWYHVSLVLIQVTSFTIFYFNFFKHKFEFSFFQYQTLSCIHFEVQDFVTNFFN